jgi:RecA/RadA recombinase
MEDLITSKVAEFGVLGIVILFSIREFFSYLKAKKEGNGSAGKEIVTALQKMGSNDLEHIKECISNSNTSVKDCLHSDMLKMIEILGRIEGRLSNQK